MNETTAQLLESLIKENACSAVELSSGVLQVVFGTRRLVIQSSWRFVKDSEIVAASDSDSGRIDLVQALLDNKSVENVCVSAPFSDLELRFAGGVLLQTFADSEKYEHWYFSGGPQEMIVAEPGNLWSSFELTHDPADGMSPIASLQQEGRSRLPNPGYSNDESQRSV